MSKYAYYLSIRSTSLAHYIGKALLLPSRFYKNRPDDIQTIEADYLILSKVKFLKNSNCSVEIILNNQELEYLKETSDKNIFFYTRPIPISRIKKIFFIEEVQKLKTIDNIQRGVGFIPEELIEIANDENVDPDIETYSYKYNQELVRKIKLYDQILGGLAFVRHGLEGNYSNNYFSILSHFNILIAKDFEKAGHNIDHKYDGSFTGNGKFWEKLYNLIYDDIVDNDVLLFSENENINIVKSNGIWQYEAIEKNTIPYILAILNTYGEDSRRRKKTKDYISDCKKGKIIKGKQEGIDLIYGINNGYSVFYNKYDTKLVKYKMDSLLDYYTIESIFQYTINNNKNNAQFEYIDILGIEKDISLNKYYETYTILDEIIITDKETIIGKIKKWINDIFFSDLDKYIEYIFNEIIKLKKKIREYEKQNKIIESKYTDEKDKNIRLTNKLNASMEDKDQEEMIERIFDLIVKKTPELKAIAKENGVKFTNKNDTIKAILTKDNNLLL